MPIKTLSGIFKLGLVNPLNSEIVSLGIKRIDLKALYLITRNRPEENYGKQFVMGISVESTVKLLLGLSIYTL